MYSLTYTSWRKQEGLRKTTFSKRGIRMEVGKVLFSAVCFAIAMKYVQDRYKRAGLAFGLLFGICQTMGKIVLAYGVKNASLVREYGVFFLSAAMGAGGMAALSFNFLEWISKKGKISKTPKRLQSFPVLYALILACYLPCFIAYFPGCMSYDSWYITLEALGIIGFDNHHPFLHTLLWSIFAHMDEWLGIKQIGITLYTMTQLLAMAAVYAYTCVWISRRNLAGPVKKIACIYYAFNPVFHIFTLILTKDVLFSGFFLLLNITLADFLENMFENSDQNAPRAALTLRNSSPVGKWMQMRLTALLLLCCLFRNNMIYVVIAFTVFLCFLTRKFFLRFKSFFLAILLFYIITKVVYPGIGVARGSVKEMLSVPLSQIAAVYHKEGANIGEEEKRLINIYIPSVERYDRFFADPVKGDFNESAFEENKREFFHMWGNFLGKYPVVCGEAFLALNLPFWYPEMESVREYIETDNYSQDYPVVRKGWLPQIYNWYETVSENEAVWMHLPVMKQLYSIGVPVWVLLFFGIRYGLSKRKAALSVIVLNILLWMTYLLGPVSSFRYAEPLFLTYPLWLALCSQPAQRNVLA